MGVAVLVAVLVALVAGLPAPPTGKAASEGSCSVAEQGVYSAREEQRKLTERRLGTQGLIQAKVNATMDPKPGLFTANELVAELTTDNLLDNVHPLNQNTVVHVFAPWCPVCQVFDPLYQELASKNSDRADVTFGMINGDNDIDLRHRLKVDSYPALIIIKKGTNIRKPDLSKDVAVFDGKRTMDEMSEWIRKQCPTKWDLEEQKKKKDEKKKVAKNFLQNAAKPPAFSEK